MVAITSIVAHLTPVEEGGGDHHIALRGLVEFVRNGLFDKRVRSFCKHLPDSVPSGMRLQVFEGCPRDD